MEGELQVMNENLYQLYIRSSKLAAEHWLPQVKASKDSFNSLPHLIGVKRRIDRILYPEEESKRVDLSAFELYVLLNAILFHDIGKGVDGNIELIKKGVRTHLFSDFPELSPSSADPSDSPSAKPAAAQSQSTGEEKKPDCASVHAYISMQIVKQWWAELGIVSEHVAQVVGDICKFHDALSDEPPLPEHLYIDDFGPVRVSILGALLILGDQLDNTYTRIPPEYMKITGVYSAVGKFRSKIRSTWIDPVRRMACTEIDDIAFTLEQLEKYTSASVEDRAPGRHPLLDYIYCHLKQDGTPYRHGRTRPPAQYLSVKTDNAGDYEEVSVLYSMMGNTCENNVNLGRIQNELYILGMPIKKWLIEYNGHLFQVNYRLEERADRYRLSPPDDAPVQPPAPADARASRDPNVPLCKEVFDYKHYRVYATGSRFALEPVLDLAYCKRILTAVYMLAGGILGKPYHDYFDLLNYIRADESNLHKVKCAVARISKLLTLFECENGDRVNLYHDEQVWMLSVLPKNGERSEPNASSLSLQALHHFLIDILQ